MAGESRVVALVVMAAMLVGLSAAVRTNDQLPDGCRITSDVGGGDRIDCDFADFGIDTKILSSEDLHANITYIRIANCQSLELGENAISHLPHVRGIYLKNIQRLDIASNNWTLTARQTLSPAIVEIDRVSLLRLESRAFSGLGRQLADITVSNVAKCLIMSDAFSTDSSFRRVSLQNIGNLSIFSNAFRAFGDEVVLVNVSMKTCLGGTFGGELENITMHSVKIGTVRGRCLETRPGWFSGGSLTIQSSNLETIVPSGIYGDYWYRVVIEDSEIGRVVSKGLDIYTHVFTVKCTRIGELESNALDVRFFEFAEVQMSSIDALRVDAFRSLRATSNATSLTIRNLILNEAESGSLAFSNGTLVFPRDVTLRRSCEHKGLALRLVAGDIAREDVTKEQWRIVHLIRDELYCVGGGDRAVLAQSSCRSCTAHDDDMTSCPRSPWSPWSSWEPEPKRNTKLVRFWVVGLVASAFLLVLLFVGAAMLLAKRSRGRERSDHSDESSGRNSNHDDVLTDPATSEPPEVNEPLHGTTAGNVRSDERPITATPSDLDPTEPAVLQSGVVDRELDRPGLPRPPSSEYMEMAPLRPSAWRPPVPTSPAGAGARREEHLPDNLHPKGGKSLGTGAPLYENLRGRKGERLYENLHGKK